MAWWVASFSIFRRTVTVTGLWGKPGIDAEVYSRSGIRLLWPLWYFTRVHFQSDFEDLLSIIRRSFRPLPMKPKYRLEHIHLRHNTSSLRTAFEHTLTRIP